MVEHTSNTIIHTCYLQCFLCVLSNFVNLCLKWIPLSKGLQWVTGIACWLERRTHDRNVVSSNPGRSGGRISFSRVNLVYWLSFGVHSTPVLLQWHIKDTGHSAKSTGGRLHLSTHTPLTRQSRSGLTMLLFRQSVGIYQETSSHTTCQGKLGHSCLSSLSHCGLILASKKLGDKFAHHMSLNHCAVIFLLLLFLYCYKDYTKLPRLFPAPVCEHDQPRTYHSLCGCPPVTTNDSNWVNL